MDPSFRRRQLLVGGAALAIAGSAYAAEPRRKLVDFSRSSIGKILPMSVGPWTGYQDPDVVPETVDASVDDGQTVSRRYSGNGVSPIMLVVSYHGPQTPDLKVHRPETCYAVAGFEGGSPLPVSVAVAPGLVVPAVHFTARRLARTETVLYWTRVGDRFPQTLTGQRIDFLTEAMRGVRADGLLMRASVISDNSRQSLATLSTFAKALIESSTSAGRKLLLGPSASIQSTRSV